MSRRRVIVKRGEPPTPVEPYLNIAPKHIWIADDIDNYVIVFSNVGWITV